jgi:G patch domain-containing protein 1
LHGAFTGGFSAGYFNTVGSKEGASTSSESSPPLPSSARRTRADLPPSPGWTPATFVSSRSDRAKQKASRPEDYMDEEDIAELRENQIMSGVKEQQQRDVFAGAQPVAATGDPEQE